MRVAIPLALFNAHRYIIALLMHTVTSRRTGSFALRVDFHLLPFIKFRAHLISFGTDLCRARVAARPRWWKGARAGSKPREKLIYPAYR